MEDPFQEILQEVLPLKPCEGQSKVMPLDEALRRHLQPGMALHLGMACTPPLAIIYELVRQFRDKDPRFTLISLGLTTAFSLLVHTGLVRKAVTTYAGDSYPSPGPNPAFQRAVRDGALKIEHWSLLSLTQRLRAGAMGIPFLPTRSLLGSTMEKENREDFLAWEAPFGEGKRLGLVRALTPDVSLYHGLAADPQGNTLFAPPYAENLYGALAAKKGAIVTVEKIVSTDFLRAHAGYVRLPGYRVLGVSEVPFGGHPAGCTAHGVDGLEGYAVDNPFLAEIRKACKNRETLQSWMEDWVLACPDRISYLQKLGSNRLRKLKEGSHPESWQKDLEALRPGLQIDEPANAMERMVVAASREIISRVKGIGCRTLLAGIGASNLAAWLATYALRREAWEVDVIAELGFFGYLPRPGDPFIFNLSNVPTCKMLTDVSEILGLLMGGANQRCLGALSAAQVDRWGNLNSTWIPPDTLITGSGGANDVASAASEVLAVLPQSRPRFVPRVPYITAPGDRVRAVVSTLGLFEKMEGDREFSLTGVMEDGKSSRQDRVREAKEQCGWELKTASQVKVIPLPRPAELALLRLFDPQRFFLTGPV